MALAGSISRSEARRLTLHALGLSSPRPRRAGIPQLRRVISRLGLLQIDYVNVLVPAHYQVPFSRLGLYDRGKLDQLVYRRREFTEQWAHEASIVPFETWPLLKYRMEAFRTRPYAVEPLLRKRADYLDWVVEQIRRRGPLAASDLPDWKDIPRKLDNSWIGTVPRAALETLFGRGRLAAVGRRSDFSRVYDLVERVLPRLHLARAPMEQSQRALLLLAAKSYGVASARDLADYYRMSMTAAKPRLRELVEAGELTRVVVEDWKEPAYLDPSAKTVTQACASTLVSPFDPVVWCRPRAARVFGLDYLIEIFVPKAKRKWGYYVLPFLVGERFVARVDLKADRKTGTLQVLASHLEPHAKAGEVAPSLAIELGLWAQWLGLSSVHVMRRGGLARALSRACRSL